jgi:hypothetical protein
MSRQRKVTAKDRTDEYAQFRARVEHNVGQLLRIFGEVEPLQEGQVFGWDELLELAQRVADKAKVKRRRATQQAKV